jgi:hypothetical protein
MSLIRTIAAEFVLALEVPEIQGRFWEVQEVGLLEVEVPGVELRFPQKFARQTVRQTCKVDSSQIRLTF